jgi:pentatricopeptide repeat protein
LQHKESDVILDLQQQNATARLWTYAYNIPKSRRENKNDRVAMTRPVHSLVAFLQEADQPAVHDFHKHEGDALERATIQAVRAASAAGDYRLIFTVVEAAIVFCKSRQQSLLPARLFGEAIESLSRTSCSVSKLKQIWRLSQTHCSLLREPMGAFELNTMLRALSSRGKIRAALDLSEVTDIVGDSYSMSTLMMALTASISDHQSPSNDWVPSESISPCWQYNEGRHLLETCLPEQLNNHVFAAALRLNERAGLVFGVSGQRHYAAKAAMDLLRLMKKRGVSPDVVTCTLIASAFDKSYQWKAAVALLDAMHKKGGVKSWSLPEPNEYVYSSVISACARCSEYDAALQVLDSMRASIVARPNTWVYNAALASCVGSKSQSQQKRSIQSRMALTLLNQMQHDHQKGMDTAPDSVSYNTALAAIEGMGVVAYDEGDLIFRDFHVSSNVPEEWSSEEAIAYELVQQMKQRGLPRDALTYHNAIKASRSNGIAVLRMVDAATEDLQSTRTETKFSGRAAQGLIFVFNSALSALSSGDDLDLVATVLSKMTDSGVQANLETIVHLFAILGASGKSAYIPDVLQALDGDRDSRNKVNDDCHIDVYQTFTTASKFELELRHYSAAIKACLTVNDIDTALKGLSMMREKGFAPDTQSLHKIALAYCRLATEASAKESKIGRRVRKYKRSKITLRMDMKRRVSVARARSALDIALALENPSVHLLATISTACASAGMWAEARMLLGRLHNAASSVEYSPDDVPFDSRGNNEALSVLPCFHRSLLKLCASKGNVTAALGFVDDIQALSKRFSGSDEKSNDDTLFSSLFNDSLDTTDVGIYAPTIMTELTDTNDSSYVGMKGEDWKLLLIAASKSGHWRVCLGTLQFLRPFLEATNPNVETESNRNWLSKRYDKLARSLTAAILCFEMRGQYAWAIRAIEDWIEWSGRRPRKEAILATYRILAGRGQGYEVNRLLTRVLQVPVASPPEYEIEFGSSYEEILCTGALNALHANGLYDDADVLYVQAYTQGYLPFSVERADSSNGFTLDLHGMNVAMAHSAVRIALQQYVLPESSSAERLSNVEEKQKDGDMIIVTGRGINSAQRLRPVLRPEIQRMLLEEFYPPLSTTSIPGNIGALRVPANDVKEWVLEQRQQKGARMLAIADVIKNLTSGERIRKSIELTLHKSDETPKENDGEDDK